ncbi:MAG: hypothetical protein H0W69_02590 [Gemmatimonadaceae bacterium]|nr:hypothetical protein [Gemmatimonadaceae bacterium]
MIEPGNRPTFLRWSRKSSTDARAWVATFAFIVSAFLSLIYLLCRVGFGTPIGRPLALMGLSGWLTMVPFGLHLVLREAEARYSWFTSESFLALATILVTAFVGWLVPRAGLNPFPLFGAAGGLGALLLIARQFTLSAGRSTKWFLAATVLMSVWIAGVEWANGFLSPLILENVILNGGTSKVDTWYLSSISNMVQLHGVASHGLNGIPSLSYHYGSGWLFAQFANLTGMPVFDFFNLGVPVVLIPIFFRGILVTANDLRDRRANEQFRSLHESPLIWALLAAATIGALPPMALHAGGIWASGPILSESYVTAIALSLFAIGTFGCFWMDWSDPSPGKTGKSSSALMLLGFIPLTLAGIGIIKVSQLLLLLTMVGWFFLRRSLWKKPLAVVSILLTFALALLVYRHVVTPERATGFSPLHFMQFIPTAAWIFFPFIHLFWTWAYALLRIYLLRIRDLRELGTALKSGRIPDVEFVVLLGIVGLIPGNVFDISSDQYYFSDYQRWVALTMLLGSPAILTLLGNWFAELGERGQRLPSLAKKTGIVLLAPFAITMVFTALTWGSRLVSANLATRREIQSVAGTLPSEGVGLGFVRALKSGPSGLSSFRSSQLRPLADANTIQLALKASPRFELVSKLRGLGEASWQQRRETVLFVQPDVQQFWSLLPRAPLCVYSAMVAPAVAGIPVLQGVPPGCEIPVAQLGGNYRKVDRWELEADATSSAVCAQARQKGFRRVLRIRPAQNNRISVIPLDCGA